MSTFSQVMTEWTNFQALINMNIPGQSFFEQISVEEPQSPEDELYFMKLVSWSYILFVESFPALYKQINSNLRVASTDDLKKIGVIYQNIHALRTHQGHNLVPTSSADQKKINLVTIWKTTYGGNPINWQNCCAALCTQIIEALIICKSAINRIVVDPKDLSTFTDELIFSIERKWEAHHFDRLVELALNNLSINNFDIGKYRKSRLDEWQKNVEYFSDRADAEKYMARLIFSELKAKFG